LKVEILWKKALERNIWGKMIKEAKVHKGLYSQRTKKKEYFDVLPFTGY
jgi:hypothetical protein